jgi:hypothetical protein
MRVDPRPRRQNAPRPAWKVAEAFKQWLRGRRCLVENADCWGPIQSAHVDYAGKGTGEAKGLGTKVADRWCVPLCAGHHGEQTDVLGWPGFEAKYRINAEQAAADLWLLWPGRAKWEQRNG